MNKTLALIFIVFLVLIGGLYLIATIDESTVPEDRGGNTPPSNEVPEKERVVDETLGFAFTYENGEAGYTLISPPPTQGGSVKAYTLIETSEYRSLMSSEIPREGPPSISVRIYQDLDHADVRTWSETHKKESTSDLRMGEITETVVGGEPAIRYTADGLYPTDTVVVAHGSFVYVITGSYDDAAARTKRDFEPFLNSITFSL